ncbi:MAG: SDR family oxidoreductase [Phycisphaerae bacterium]|nr:SDR family oxidoreductase [Phycisphaerae bacterium]
MSEDRNTALITGASSGIGADAAKALAGKGFRVCLFARREERLNEVAVAINDSVGDERAIVFAGDVTNSDDRAAVVDLVMDRWGRLDVLVNNAGDVLAGVLEDVSLDEVRRQFEINTFAPLAMMQLAGPIMRRQKRGRIINVSSISGIMAIPGVGAYAGSKFALEGLSDAARREYYPWGIKVVLIEPGGIGTDIWTQSKADFLARLETGGNKAFKRFYEQQLAQLEQLTHGGYPVKIVTEAICHAATAVKPKPRYCMPRMCRDRKFAAKLPTELQDRLVRHYVKVEPNPE